LDPSEKKGNVKSNKHDSYHTQRVVSS